MSEILIYFIGILALSGLGFLIRFLAQRYAKGQIALIMLSVEKRLSTWAKIKAENGEMKRKEAEKIIVEKLYPFLPVWSKMFINQDWLIKQIDLLYLEMLDFLDENKKQH